MTHDHPALPMITLEGCRAFCGGGPMLYSWDILTESFMTWLLPLLGGLLLQIPLESGGSISATVLQLARWLGSPIVIMTLTLHDILDTRRACRLFDRLTSDEFPRAGQEGGQEDGIQLAANPSVGGGLVGSNTYAPSRRLASFD